MHGILLNRPPLQNKTDLKTKKIFQTDKNLNFSDVMAGIIPLLFSPSRRTQEEEEKFQQQEKIKFGQHLENLGNIYHVKPYVEFLNDFNNSSYVNKIFLIANRFQWQAKLFGMFGYDTFTTYDEERCKWCFTEYSRCLDTTARTHGQDPLKTDTMTETFLGHENCHTIQELAVEHCSESTFLLLSKHRRTELKLARFRRFYLSTFADLKEDWGFKRYPSYILDEQKESLSVFESLKNFNFKDLFKYDYAKYSEQRDLKRIEFAEYDEKLWPEDKRSEKQRKFTEFKESTFGVSPGKELIKQFKELKEERDKIEKVQQKLDSTK